jgi:hypothetical protein
MRTGATGGSEGLEAVSCHQWRQRSQAGREPHRFERPAVAEAVPIAAGPPFKPVAVRRFVVFIEAARASNE